MAPGHYSLGRGYLALHQYQIAYDHLIKAWNEYEYRIPAVEYSLGYSLAMLYHQKLNEAEQTVERLQLNERKDELNKTYRDPALEFIRRSSFTSEAPEYVAALLAFFSKDYKQSLKYSDIASKKFPSLYEAQTLQGDIYKAIGDEQRDTGKIVEAEQSYANARAAYEAAAKKGQSDPSIFVGLCALQNGIMRMQSQQIGISPHKAYEESISYCNLALRADPENIPALLTSAWTHVEWGLYQKTRGQDVKEAIDKAVYVSKLAIQLDPENPSAHLSLGNAYLELAGVIAQEQKDPTIYLDLAEKNLAIVISKNPENARAYFMQGSALHVRARHEKIIGKDPRPSLKKAISSLQKAIAQNPKDTVYYNRLGSVYFRIAEYETHNGLDPSNSLKSAINEYQLSLEINPNIIETYTYIANSHNYLAEWKMSSGQDPVPSFDSAISAYQRTLNIDPKDAYTFAGIGYALWKKAEHLYSKGKDPSSVLQSARNSLQKAEEFNRNILECYAIHAYVEQIAARYAMDRKRDPSHFFEESEKIINKALAIKSNAFESLGALASLCLLRANHLHSIGKPMEAEINKGIHAADRSLAEGWQDPDTLVVRGGLYLLRARTSRENVRLEAAREAEQSYLRAIQGKASLQSLHQDKLKEVRKIMESPN